VLPAVRHLVVVVYLTAAGWFFVLAPWSGYWARQVVASSPLWLATVLGNPSLRGALSAFGILHFAMAYAWLNAVTPKQ
jgi:hypothetical protein